MNLRQMFLKFALSVVAACTNLCIVQQGKENIFPSLAYRFLVFGHFNFQLRDLIEISRCDNLPRRHNEMKYFEMFPFELSVGQLIT